MDRERIPNEEELYDRGFNNILDKYLSTNIMTAEDYESLTPTQTAVVQTLKRAIARLTKRV